MVAKVQSTKVCGEKSTREKCKSASSFSSYRLLHTSTGYGAWRARREYYNTYQHAAHESVFARTFRVRIARHRVYLSCTTRDSCFSSCDVHVHTLGKAYYSYTLPAPGLFSAPKYPRQRTATAPNRASSRLACSKTADPVSLECPRCDHAGGSWAEHTARRGPQPVTRPARHTIPPAAFACPQLCSHSPRAGACLQYATPLVDQPRDLTRSTLRSLGLKPPRQVADRPCPWRRTAASAHEPEATAEAARRSPEPRPPRARSAPTAGPAAGVRWAGLVGERAQLISNLMLSKVLYCSRKELCNVTS